MILILVRFRKSRVNVSLFLVAKHLGRQIGYDVTLPSMTRWSWKGDKRLSSKEVRKIQKEIQLMSIRTFPDIL